MRYAGLRIGAVAIAMASILMLLSTPGAALAKGQTVVVSIPFNFHVGAEKLGPGTYTIRLFSEFLQIQDRNGRSWMVLSNAPGDRLQSHGTVVFSKHGADYFLSEVRWDGITRTIPHPQSQIGSNLNGQPLIGLTARR